MKLISWNVNGLRALHRKELLYPFLDKYQPDILCLQETKSHREQLTDDILYIPGYTSYFESGIRKGYSGVAIYSKTEPISIQTGFKEENLSKNMQAILELRDEYGVSFGLYPEIVSFKKALQYSNRKHYTEAIFFGSDEAKAGEVLVKNMQTGEQRIVLVEDLGER